MDDLVGRVVGPYRLESMIGHGPTGDVYRGVHLSAGGRLVAVKLLRASIAVGADLPKRFSEQMRAISSLRHPNIITMYDFGIADGLCYIGMELMLAGSVRSLLRRRLSAQPLPTALATDLICQAAEGLADAHERGIIHKDIRPSNLLLDDREELLEATDEAYTLKVADFGLAQLAADESAMTFSGMMLGSGLMLGAPAYMSPELCRGHAVDGRSDLYALGVVLYEMVTGVLPVPTTRREDIARERLYTPPTLPRLLNPEISPSLEYVMLRCLARQADDRFDTALDLARALRAAEPAG